jgi:hypothetical protein
MKGTRKGTRKVGRRPKHGGYSIALQDNILKANPRVQKYLLDCREGLIKDLAGTEAELSEQQRIMIDRIISRMAICRLIELYVEKFGAFRRDRIDKDKVFELEPCLGVNYLAFSNSIDRALIALGLDKRKSSEVLDLGRYIEERGEDPAQNPAEQAAFAAPALGDGQGEGMETGRPEIVDPRATLRDFPED